MVWSGTTSAFAGTTAITGNGTYSMGVNTANTPRTIYRQYGTNTNLSTGTYTWSFTFTTTTTTVTDLTNASTHAALASNTNSWRYWLAASSATSGSNGYCLTQDGGKIKLIRTNGSNEKYQLFQTDINIAINAKYAVRVVRTSDNLWTLYADANTDNATTKQGNSTNEPAYFNSGSASIFTKFEANTTSANIFKFDNVYFGVPSVTMAALTNGLASTVLTEGATNQALIGVSVTPTGSAALLSAMYFQNTNDNRGGVYTNGKLIRSTDNSFATTGDNTTVSANVYLQTNYVEVSGMNVTVAAGTTANFFLVYDLQSPFGGTAPTSMQFSMTQSGGTTGVTSDLVENSFSITSPTYTLAKVYTWNGNSSTNWNTAANWTYNGGTSTTVPGASNAVRIGVSSFNNQPTVTANSTVASITFGKAKDAILTVNSGSLLTISGSIAVNNESNKNVAVTIAGAGSMSVGTLGMGGLTETPNPGTKTASITSTINSLTVSGNVVLNSVGSEAGRLNDAQFYLQSGTMTVNGSIQTLNSYAGNVSLFQMNSGAGTATLNLSASNPFSLSATGTNTISLAGTSTTVIYNGTTQNIPTSTYTNVIMSGAGDKTATGALTVNGLLTISTGINLDMGTNQLAGTTLTTSGTGTIKTQNTGSTPIPTGKTWTTDVLYNATSSQSVVNGTYNNLALSNSTSAKTATGTLTINGALTVSSGSILDMATNQLLGSLTSTGSIGGTIKTQNTSATPIPTGKTWVTDILYNATGSQTVVAGDYRNLNLTGGNRTLVNGGTIGITGLLTPGSGTITSTGNTVDFKGSVTQLIPSATYNNVIISNAGKTADANFTVNGLVTVNSGLTLDMVTYQLLGTSLTTSTTGTLTTQNNSTTPLPTGRTWGMNVFYNSTSSQTVIAGNYNNLNIAGGNRTLISSGAIAVAGTLTAGAGTITTTGSTVNFNGTGIQSIPAFNYNNLTISNNGGVKTLAGATTVNSALSLTGGNLTIGAGNTLTLNGTFTGSATNSLSGSATSNITVGGTGALGTLFFNQTTDQTTNNIATLTINRTASGTLSLGNNLNITSLLQLNNGIVTLAANDTVTLRSTSITNTAMVGQVGSSAGFVYGTGAAFRVERFIPQNTSNNNRGVRAYRDLAPGVNNSSLKIFDQWQEGGINNNGYGTHITGKVGTTGMIDAATGFDMTISGNKSLQAFNVSTVNGSAAWATINSTKADTLSAFKGLRLYIRGNRTTSLASDLAYMSSTATLRATGKLVTGTVTFRTTGVTNNGATNTGIRLNSGSLNGFTIVPNPYAAPIDWFAVYASSSNILPSCWIFDSNVGTAGAYVTYNQTTGISSNPSASQVNRYIQPGQSFFIKNNNSTSPVVVISEAHKAVSTSNLTAVFGAEEEPLSKLVLSLHKKVDTTYVNMDGAVMCFKSTFDKTTGFEDAGKITNSNENIAVYSNETLFSIEGTKAATATDSIRLRLWQTTAGASYKLKIDLTAYALTGLQPVLKDRFTKSTITPSRNGITEYNFTTTGDTISYNYRFTIVFVNASSVLPVTYHAVKAYQKQAGNNVEWTVTETGVDDYTVEYSADGNNFGSIGKVLALNTIGNNVTYEYYHSSPSSVSFYRIKSTDKTGSIKYSNIVSVSNRSNKDAVVSVYPNPVKNKTANLIFSGIAAGSYQVSVYSNDGRVMYQKSINHNGLNGSYNINLPQNLPAGTYNLKVINDTMKYNQLLVIE